MNQLLYSVYQAASLFLRLVSGAVFIYCMLTWIAPRSPARYWLERFIEPFCAPFRSLARTICMRWGSPFDLTCFFAIIGLNLLQYALRWIFMLLIRIF